MPDPLGVPPIGIFGGTFDPLHFAHLRLAEDAADALGLETVRWIPAGQPLHRVPESKAPPVAAEHRLEMVRLAISDNARFVLDDADVRTGQPSYTVPTLERLRGLPEIGAQRPLVLLVGADAFAGMAGWHRWSELFDLAHVAVACRPGYGMETAMLPPALAARWNAAYSVDPAVLRQSPAGRIVSFPMTQLDISATHIRDLLSKGASARYLVPRNVITYIQTHHLYTEN